MIKKITYILILFPIVLSAQQNDYGSPEWLIKRFFIDDNFPEKSFFYGADLSDKTDLPSVGEENPAGTEVNFRNIFDEQERKVFAVNVKSPNTQTDYYAFLGLTDDVWRIEFVRSFWLPESFYHVRDSLRTLTSIPDSLKTDFEVLELMTSSDETIKNHFLKNKKDFNVVAEAFKNEDESAIDNLINQLKLTAVFVEEQFTQCIFIEIGSFQSSSVGYIKCEDENSLPQISPFGFIYLEKIEVDWLVFMTI